MQTTLLFKYPERLGFPSYTFQRISAPLNWLKFKIDKRYPATIYQSLSWLSFLAKTQRGEPVVAVLKEGQEVLGYFTGLIVRKFGVPILGSPFPGWSTDYMGLRLSSMANRRLAVQALMDFAFQELGCLHLEMMDRSLTVNDISGLGFQSRVYHSFEVDLTRDEEQLFLKMKSACRRCVRKAEREGVVIEEARDAEFADEYYAQLQDVFAKQRLVPTYGVERVRQLIRDFQPAGQLLLLRARNRQGQCIATGIFPYMNGVMYFWGGASWRHSQSLRPNEALQWQAMKLGKKKGVRTYDMGGGGEYKRKYGGKEIIIPWFGKSKYTWIQYLRDMAQNSHKARQHCLGELNHFFARR